MTHPANPRHPAPRPGFDELPRQAHACRSRSVQIGRADADSACQLCHLKALGRSEGAELVEPRQIGGYPGRLVWCALSGFVLNACRFQQRLVLSPWQYCVLGLSVTRNDLKIHTTPCGTTTLFK